MTGYLMTLYYSGGSEWQRSTISDYSRNEAERPFTAVPYFLLLCLLMCANRECQEERVKHLLTLVYSFF
jgi:hypothetical protein